MLVSFRVANHRSLREEQQLLLSPVYGADGPEDAQAEAVPVAALFGANAAGKSNVVHALRFMRRMVVSSHRDAEPDEGIARFPFLLDPGSRAEPSWYVVDLVVGGVRHTYGFSIDDERVLDEWLYSYPQGRRRKLFQRSGDEIAFGDSLPKRELELVQRITAPNALFISVAARSRQEAVRPVYDWFLREVSFRTGGAHHTWHLQAMRSLENPGTASKVTELLRVADLGIEAVGVETVQVPTEHGLKRAGNARRQAVLEAMSRGDRPETEPRTRVWVEQRGRNGTTRLGLEDQSEGTRRLLDYAGPVLETLERGGLLVVDEVDSSLHPKLTAHLVKLFQESTTNPNGAQLLLTTHDVSLLGRSDGEDILKRDQIWFVEKDEHGETSLFPLSDFKPRREENRERRYLGGSYGAVPYLSDERFEAAVAARGGNHGESSET